MNRQSTSMRWRQPCAAGRPVTFYRYQGLGHWFFEKDRPDAYDPSAARLAWEQAISFLRGSTSP